MIIASGGHNTSSYIKKQQSIVSGQHNNPRGKYANERAIPLRSRNLGRQFRQVSHFRKEETLVKTVVDRYWLINLMPSHYLFKTVFITVLSSSDVIGGALSVCLKSLFYL